VNFLLHMVLSGDDDALLTGNFMGDFVKGPLSGRFPVPIRQGIELHRRIDSFAERDPAFRRSRERLSPRYGRYRGVMVDLFYDHLLIGDWSSWCGRPYLPYLVDARRRVERYRDQLPPDLLRLVPYLFEELFPSYRQVEGIGRALARLSRRLTRVNPLAGGEAELLRQREGLTADFREFTPRLAAHAAEQLIVLGRPPSP
jgi:acyl carrier protein phosphodiesterase